MQMTVLPQARCESGARPESLSAVSACHVFPTRLGWCGICGRDGLLVNVTLAHRTKQAARDAICGVARGPVVMHDWDQALVESITRYLGGVYADFSQVPVALERGGPFERRVLEACRRIPCGQTATYGELARQCGSSGAARAVGHCMARNPVPLIIPCHRVVRADGRLGHYSATGGAETKRAILRMEATMASTLGSVLD